MNAAALIIGCMGKIKCFPVQNSLQLGAPEGCGGVAAVTLLAGA